MNKSVHKLNNGCQPRDPQILPETASQPYSSSNNMSDTVYIDTDIVLMLMMKVPVPRYLVKLQLIQDLFGPHVGHNKEIGCGIMGMQF